MQLINIFPIGNLCMEFDQPMHMYLTHLVEKYPAYVDTALKAGGYKILDNSLIELGGAVDMDRILAAAEEIKADEIILPDVFQDGPGTIEAVEDALAYLHKLYPRDDCPYKLMAVAQGKNVGEWHLCYKKLLRNSDIDVIGIPKVCAKMHPEGRPYFVNELCELNKKQHHLLGLWYSMTEFAGYHGLDMIRSCDTILLGYLAKHRLHSCDTRPDGFTVDLEKDVIDYRRLDQSPIKLFDSDVQIGYGKMPW